VPPAKLPVVSVAVAVANPARAKCTRPLVPRVENLARCLSSRPVKSLSTVPIVSRVSAAAEAAPAVAARPMVAGAHAGNHLTAVMPLVPRQTCRGTGGHASLPPPAFREMTPIRDTHRMKTSACQTGFRY
jgi:hypothetical protein